MKDGEVQSGGFWQWFRSGSGTKVDRRNQYVFCAWTLVWAVSYTAASWVLKNGTDMSIPLVLLLIAIPTLVGLVAMFAYLRLLRMADGLLARIQLEGLALGFAAGMLFTAGYQLAEFAGAPPLKANYIIVVMVFSWVVGQLLGIWRYR